MGTLCAVLTVNHELRVCRKVHFNWHLVTHHLAVVQPGTLSRKNVGAIPSNFLKSGTVRSRGDLANCYRMGFYQAKRITQN
jgi:hypothetical protein